MKAVAAEASKADATNGRQAALHDELLSPDQAAREMFGVSPRKFAYMRNADWMPKAIVLGPRVVRYSRAELCAAVAKMPRGVIAEPAQLVGKSKAKKAILTPGAPGKRSSSKASGKQTQGAQ